MCYNIEEYQVFNWMCLENEPEWSDIEKTIQYLKEKKVDIDDSVIFDEFNNLRNFIKSFNEKTKQEWQARSCCDKWVQYFQKRPPSELLKICTYCFAIPGHNANTERVFSLMRNQWTDSRNSLSPNSIKNILTVQFNFKNVTCTEFYDIYCKTDLLKKIRSNEKYQINNS